MKAFFVLVLLFAVNASAHVPALLLPLKGTPISSYFIGQSDVSRAVYSELTTSDDIFVAHLNVKKGAESTLVELLTPVCEALPQYERFQPSALVIKGDLPWKNQGESNAAFVERLKKKAVARISSDYSPGSRPKFYEETQKQYYWQGGKWQGRLAAGLYAIVVFDGSGNKGNFTLAINEKEAWTPDLFKYVGEVLPVISAGLCNPSGFTGRLEF